jgi:hypothetical protein
MQNIQDAHRNYSDIGECDCITKSKIPVLTVWLGTYPVSAVWYYNVNRVVKM